MCRLTAPLGSHGGRNQCKLKITASPLPRMLLSSFWCRELIVIWYLCGFPFPLSKQVKKEEEEFSTGPLSVLMMSVKNNTQVGRFPLENTVSSLQSVYIDFTGQVWKICLCWCFSCIIWYHDVNYSYAMCLLSSCVNMVNLSWLPPALGSPGIWIHC